jgi:molybdenum cofactor cytidylyltransferase
MMSCAALVLAAGASTRWGKPKQLLSLRGQTLIDRSVQTALEAGCSPVVRVLGAHSEAIHQRPCPHGALTVINPAWNEGMGGSLAFGVRSVLAAAPQTEAVVVLLCDQPLVTPRIITTLLAAGRTRGKGIVLCDPGEGRPVGPPAVFGRAYFEALQSLSGDVGARVVARRNLEDVATVHFGPARWDLDSPEDCELFLNQHPEWRQT